MDVSDGFGLQPLAGGFSGETFLGEAAGERTVVRLYVDRGARRGPAAPEVDAMPTLPVEVRRAVGRNLGILLGRMTQMPMPRFGTFADGDLTIQPWPPYELSDEQVPGLEAVAEDAQALLDEVDRVCLVHSDVNPKNVLVDPATGEITGLLDWEFAHAGHPATDLGNLLRFDREPVFAQAVLDGYLEVAGHLDGLASLDNQRAKRRLLDRARAADLAALAELASRKGENPVADRAEARLKAIVRSRDLHAE
jgi:Ser/Thr protein kinase RdoA (MazF antagonist)